MPLGPWLSRGDEHPLVQMQLRAGETYSQAHQLIEVDEDDVEIGPKNWATYDRDLFELTVSATPGGAPLLSLIGPAYVSVSGAEDEGTLLFKVPQADTQALFDALAGAQAHGSVWGVDTSIVDPGNPAGRRDLLWKAVLAVYPAESPVVA